MAVHIDPQDKVNAKVLASAASEMSRASSEAKFTLAVARLLREINGSHADVHGDVLDAARDVARTWLA